MNPISVEDKLAVNKYDVDKDIHIKVNKDTCETCEIHSCLYVCPAECFKLTGGHIIFSYEGCLECGSCRIVCGKKAIEWSLPRSGFGVCFEYG